jgi:hypothetical protein
VGLKERSDSALRATVCSGEPSVEHFGWRFQGRDKVIQTETDYDKDGI